jgi:sarcosine oxidase, subunit beta
VETFDVVVVGAGVVGASTAYHLARLGGLKVALVERGQIASGGTGKSCAIVRTHYSVRSNTVLTLHSLAMLRDLGAYLDDPEADAGFVSSGYLILAPEGRFADSLRANLDQQKDSGAETWTISKEEALERHPLLALDDVAAIGFEPRSGYADPYLTTSSFVRAARRLGVELRTGTPVRRLRHAGDRVTGVETDQGPIEAGAVVGAVGPWSAGLVAGLGLELPLEVSRHIVLTFRASAPYGPTTPVVKDLVTDNKMYFRPATGGVVLVGTGDHGDPVPGPEAISDAVGLDFVELQGRQVAHRMPSFADAAPTASWTGAYDITPDWNPVLGPVPGLGGLHLAFGFSGHGFKLAPAVGKALAQTVLGRPPDIDLHPYRLGRFADGDLLTGSYGIGSIS